MTWWLVPSGLCMPSQQSGIHSFFSEHDILGIWNLVMVENQEHVTAQGNSLCCVRESQFSIENEFPHTPKRNVYWMNLAKISFNRHSLPVEWIWQNFHSTDIPSRSGHPPTNSAKSFNNDSPQTRKVNWKDAIAIHQGQKQAIPLPFRVAHRILLIIDDPPVVRNELFFVCHGGHP